MSVNDFLRKLGLTDSFTTEIKVDKEDFIKNLKGHVGQSGTGFIMFESLEHPDKEYVGEIRRDGFELRKRKKLFEQTNSALATGTYEQKEELLIVRTKIVAIHGLTLLPVGIIILFIIISHSFASDSNTEDNFMLYFVPYFMLVVLYVLARRSVGKMRRDLEREFFFLTKNH